MSDVAASIAGSLDMGTTLRAIADSAQRVLRADRATCYVVSEAQAISAVFTTEPDPTKRAFLERTVGLGPREIPIWRRQLAELDPLVAVEDVMRDATIPGRLARALGSGAFLGVRLEHHSVLSDGAPALLGTIFCSYERPRRFSAADRATARSLGGLAALALANARLHGDTLRNLQRVEEQSALNRHHARHDALTGLPNRMSFLEHLGEALAAGPASAPFAVALLDLDGFKTVNDALGHHSGDALLRTVAGRLGRSLRRDDAVARLGGDEFALLLRGVADADAALRVIQRAAQAVAEPVSLQELVIDVEGSFGIALAPAHGDTPDQLLRHADAAMYLAKSHRSGQAVYDAQDDETARGRLALMGELRGAIDREELVLHYQPKVTLPDGRVAGVEALVRWQHPQRGLLPPAEFVTMAEHTTLVRPLTRYVIDHALRQRRIWLSEGLDLPIAVNLPAPHLLDAGFPAELAERLAHWELGGEGLELEITETTLIANPRRSLEVLARLREMGVRIAIDDFGTGYSSLAYLRRLPVDAIKIDKSFVLGMSAGEADATIVRSTVDIARNLGLQVVAEGVETEAALSVLIGLGCDQAQGYHISRPVPAAELADWVRARGGSVPEHAGRLVATSG